ncbi:MAG TPA: methylated-DNA--[protein]-cysteine S-methyltransferase [Gemmatimonadaceae bacterium]|jgi:AraC family transcriptional regulator of adaptative response/methylated-DNA-[protein]-cysteine methyltransferase|nr:methylated-DNA--[protein]-cysteine S-methyltransferase [Gemmatimonadaceae bacterium]
MKIRFTTADSALGSVLVAATDKGICLVSLRNSPEGSEELLRSRFPRAEVERDDAGLKGAIDVVNDRISGRGTNEPPALDLRGTEFQRDVWNQLLAIPAGETRSYLAIAQAIRRPKATRAVAQACGANPVAVLVPCHRVIMSDGSIGGYSGLPGVKRALLEAEGASQTSAPCARSSANPPG